jgi:GT2 family glycosyltransferase
MGPRQESNSWAVVCLEDIRFLYILFLGRPSEEQDQSTRIGMELRALAREFIGSSEFALAVQTPMMAGEPLEAPLFVVAPTDDIRRWAAARLPLSPGGRSRVMKARFWYMLHTAIFADEVFTRDVLKDEHQAAQLRSSPVPARMSDVEMGIEDSLLFERDWYLQTYQHVAANGGDPLQHYLFHGVAESCNPNRLFDTRWYLSAYPHVAAARVNPLVHYILAGAELGYDPHPLFSTEAFIREHPVATDPNLTPLANYLHHLVPAGLAAFPTFTAYEVHRIIEENRRRREHPEALRHIDMMTVTPTFVVLIDGGNAEARAATRKSLSEQIYQRLRVVSSPAEIEALACDGLSHFLWLDAGDTLDPEALYMLAAELNAEPNLDLIYFDHDTRTGSGSSEPFHKPDWSPDYLEAFDYIGPGACFELLRAAKLLSQCANRYDLVLRFTEVKTAIRHISEVLLHRPAAVDGHSMEQEVLDIRAIAGRLARTGRTGTVAENVRGSGSYDVRLALSTKPLVSVILPTAGRVINYDGQTVDLIVNCLEHVTAKSSYANTEFIVIDNGDLDRDRLKHINHPRIQFLTYSLPEVNIAKKINLGAAHASGDVLLILNDDVEPIANDWIERMLAHFEKPHVGIVGAKLLYPNFTIQHVGMATYDGSPEHVRRGKPRDDIGYASSTCGVRNYIAVTGAVSMTTAEKFSMVGGYSEDFPIDYNDVDFCYKFIKAGFSVVYEPKAELIHYESASIIKPPRPQDVDHFARKWGVIGNDPFYNEYCFFGHPPMFTLNYSERRH